MAEVTLEIVKPKTSTIFVGSDPNQSKSEREIAFEGKVTSEVNEKLYLAWYSSLNGIPLDDDDTSYAIHKSEYEPENHQVDTFKKPLAVGSHVVTFTAKDQKNNDMESLLDVNSAGMTGGPPRKGVETPCVIHVLIATILSPQSGEKVDRSHIVLKAKGPILWGKDEYHDPEINRIQYIWEFKPIDDSSLPSWKSSSNWQEHQQDSEDASIVTYSKTDFRDVLGQGNYQLILRVEDNQMTDDDPKFDKASINLQVGEDHD